MSTAPMTEKLFIDGPVGRLEALLDSPRDGLAKGSAVVCHPHPQHGGTMHNKVAHTLARAFVRQGLRTLRFNFRGTEASEGRYDEGVGELDDALAAIEWVQADQPDVPVWLAGFSFGAAIAVRVAIAEGLITMQPQTLNLIIEGRHKKGDVLGIARIAGIMAAKKTSDLIPLCHPLWLTHISVNLTPLPEQNAVHAQTTVKTTGQTGVEMEALTAVSVAALTLFDMCKAVDPSMVLSDIRVLEKRGGKSGHWQN